jgi:hypothetical protein
LKIQAADWRKPILKVGMMQMSGLSWLIELSQMLLVWNWLGRYLLHIDIAIYFAFKFCLCYNFIKQRKESSSIAAATRKNRKRVRTNRKKTGHHADGIFRSLRDNLEFGSIEVGKMFEGINGTKRLDDCHDLGKPLHDMFVDLCRYIKNEATTVRRLQVVGLLHSGESIKV